VSGFLVRELRESSPYLEDEGWHEVAKLMVAAANEIERLNERIYELEDAQNEATGKKRLPASRPADLVARLIGGKNKAPPKRS